MDTPLDQRPNPKELLEYIKNEELEQLRDKQGKLKIFLGAAPGVGKTYAMLESAIEERKAGIDVVVGLVETHGRKETEILLEKLEVLPKCVINYRGKDRLEFDLDLVIKRKPKLVLVDEMAHCNIPGARHNKRWQDIIELLDIGIDVYTTLNVQHIESLNNIITQLINIVVRETIPDTILERARAIELIDLPADDLIKRLKEGKVYISSDVIGLATDHFFRKDNLVALRELALRVTAEQVTAEELLHRMHGSIEKIWPTTERLLVCIGTDLMASKLIRAAFRMAKRLKTKWVAIHVEVLKKKLSEEERNNVIRSLQLVEQLGGQAVSIAGVNISKEIINFSKNYNITRIILGKSPRSRWKEIFNPSLANELVSSCNDLDLYILSNDLKNPKFNNYKKTKIYGFTTLISLGVAILCILINFLFFKYLGLSIAWNDKQFLANLGILLIGSQVIVYLGLLVKKQEVFFSNREQHTAVLHLLNKQLAHTRGIDQLLDIAIHHIAQVFDSEVLALLPEASGNNASLMYKLIPYADKNAKKPSVITLTPKEQSVAEWVYKLGQVAGLGTQTLPDNNAVYVPLLGSNGSVGVLRVLPRNANRLIIPEQLHLLENFCNQTAMALEVEMLQAESHHNK